jgi:hypothetical protein
MPRVLRLLNACRITKKVIILLVRAAYIAGFGTQPIAYQKGTETIFANYIGWDCEDNVLIASEVKVWSYNSTSHTSSKSGAKYAFSKPLVLVDEKFLGATDLQFLLCWVSFICLITVIAWDFLSTLVGKEKTGAMCTGRAGQMIPLMKR